MSAIGVAGPSAEDLSECVSGVAIGEGDEIPDDIDVGLLALDLTEAPGSAERAHLQGLLAAGVPVALVACRTENDDQWRASLSHARRELDPDRVIPLFAVATARADEGAESGLDELLGWCAEPDPPPVRSVVARAPSPDPGTAARVRAQRMAGARAGFAEVRADTATRLRAGAHELATLAEQACDGLRAVDLPVLDDWLRTQLDHYVHQVRCTLDDALDHVRVTTVPSASAEPVVLPSAVVAPIPAARTVSGEDLVVLLLGASAGLGLGRVAVSPLAAWAGLGTAGTVLTVVVGLALAATVVGIRRTSSLRTAARRHCSDAIGHCRAAVDHAAVAAIGSAEARLFRESMEPNSAPARPTL